MNNKGDRKKGVLILILLCAMFITVKSVKLLAYLHFFTRYYLF
jgi:hypothetical protein